jgi:hypothetical protein
VPIRDVDNGYKALVERIFTMGAPKISVGVFETDGAKMYVDGVTVLDVATFHEFGLGVPERSFLRGWFDENIERAREALVRLMRSVVEGKRTKEQALELFGVWLVGEIQKRMAENIPPPLAPETIARKGSDVALIDTGQLRSSVTYKIEP